MPQFQLLAYLKDFSRIVKFKRSINDCTILNFGITIAKVTPIKQKSPQTKPIIQVIDGVLLKALIKAPIPSLSKTYYSNEHNYDHLYLGNIIRCSCNQ